MRLLAGTVFDRPPHCERCDLPESECRCPPVEVAPVLVPPEKQTAKLSLEKRRKGKTVTVVAGLAAADNDFPKLLTRMKNVCGAGGTFEGDELEIQGDQREKLKQLLGEMGYKVR